MAIPSDDKVIRSNFYDMLVKSGISKDLASKLMQKLPPEDIRTIEKTEVGKHIREQTPALVKSFNEYLAKTSEISALRQEFFLELVRIGVPVRVAIKQVGLDGVYSEITIRKFETANKER